MSKRLFDILVSFIALIILSPIILIFSVVNFFVHGQPILFCQVRPGLLSKPFVIYKFRTMANLQVTNGKLLPENSRINNFGRILRSWSIDELPSLWNVLKGDMSLVGPRPLLMEYLPLYNNREAMRHNLKPGITGWAQINGRNSISWEKKLELDVWYIENQSFILDFKILLVTFMKIIKREGINNQPNKAMGKFTGSKNT
jgi:sugar transferase EpsL